MTTVTLTNGATISVAVAEDSAAVTVTNGTPISVTVSGTGGVWGSITGTLANQTDLQAALDLKATLASPTFTGTVTIPTPFTLGAVSVLPTGTELNFVDGVTSAIQTQLDAKQATLISGTNIKTINSTTLLGSGDILVSGTDEKVKYDAGDTTAGYIADKVIAGTGISVAEGAGASENKLVITNTITQYTDEMAQDAIGNAVGNGLDYDDATGAIAVDETELAHNSLGSMQGGTVGEYYHLTSAQNTDLGVAKLPLAGGTMTGGIVLVAGTTTVQPLKMVAGTNLTVAVAGVFEFDGTDLFFSV